MIDAEVKVHVGHHEPRVKIREVTVENDDPDMAPSMHLWLAAHRDYDVTDVRIILSRPEDVDALLADLEDAAEAFHEAEEQYQAWMNEGTDEP